MNSIKKHYIKTIIIYVIIQVLIRLLSAGTMEAFASSIAVVVMGLIATCTSLCDFCKCGNRRENIHKLSIGAGALFYTIREVIWIHNKFILNKGMPSMEMNSAFYLLRNMMIMSALLIILLKYTGKWDELRTIVDMFVFGVFAVYISWNGFIKFYFIEFNLGSIEIIFSVSYIITDTIIIFEYLMLYMYEAGYFKSLAKKIEVAGFLMLISLDLWKWYSTSYIEFSYIEDMLWPILLFMISTGIIEDRIEVMEAQAHRRFSVETISGFMLVVLCVIAINISTSMTVSGLFIFMMLFRFIAIKNIRLYEINEDLINQYIEANEMLKSKIYEANNIFCSLENKVRLRTQELKEKNSELFYLSNIDFLTGIPNRRNFVEYLDNLIYQGRSDQKFAVFFIDIDRFKSINDWYGHDVGDYILTETSKRLSRVLNTGDLVARLGGDEFVVVLNEIKSEEYAMRIANIMVSDFRKPFLVKDKKIFTTLSVGIAIYPVNAEERSSLMKCADIALYRSKAEGKNMVSIYDWSMKNRENRRLEIESRLCQALENDEFKLCYQPQFELGTGKILGIEALIRWKSAGIGDIDPDEFLEISEENGMIVSIGKNIIEKAIVAIKKLNYRYDMELRVAINISPRQFIEPDFVNNLKEVIFHHDVKSSWIELEISEDLTMNNEELVLARLIEISNMGVRIVMDNFGRGYSSFLYLKKFPISTIKIAMELVKGIGDSMDDYKIIKSIISMCREMEVDVMAEGVENKTQQNILKNIGCNSVQGYFLGGLMTIDEIGIKYCKFNKSSEKYDEFEKINISEQ